MTVIEADCSNVMSGPAAILRASAFQKSNVELVNGLRANLQYAQEEVSDHQAVTSLRK